LHLEKEKIAILTEAAPDGSDERAFIVALAEDREKAMPRLTSVFSKKFENHRHMVAINHAYSNFCRVHQVLRLTPAIEAGLTNTLGEVSSRSFAVVFFCVGVWQPSTVRWYSLALSWGMLVLWLAWASSE
jgi:hypothetical protein